MNDDKSVVELRRAEQTAQTGYSHEIVLHHAEGVNILAKLAQDLPVEMCRRFAADAARYFNAVLDDQTVSLDTSFGGWLMQTLKNIKVTNADTKRIKAVLEAGEKAAFSWVTAGFTQESDLGIEVTGWQPSEDTTDDYPQYWVKVGFDNGEGIASEVFLVQPIMPDNSSWMGEWFCEADEIPDGWQSPNL
jgi:hypothetical protein